MKDNKEFKEKIKSIYFKVTGKLKRKNLKYYNFTIISNNCFGRCVL